MLYMYNHVTKIILHFAFTGFMTSGDSHIHGNIGILDQIQALKWVNQNIDRFRGDPNRVTLLGHSVGGTSVGLMLIMPQTEGKGTL